MAKFKAHTQKDTQASQAMHEYRAKQQAEIDRMALLRELRLANKVDPAAAKRRPI